MTSVSRQETAYKLVKSKEAIESLIGIQGTRFTQKFTLSFWVIYGAATHWELLLLADNSDWYS